MERICFFYELKDGSIISEKILEDAFHCTHGYCRSNNEMEYYRWFYSMLDNSIVKIYTDCNMDIVKLAKSNKVLAIKLYKSRANCTAREAHEYISSIA